MWFCYRRQRRTFALSIALVVLAAIAAADARLDELRALVERLEAERRAGPNPIGSQRDRARDRVLGRSLLAVVLLAACAECVGLTAARTVPFGDVASAPTSRHEGGPALVVGTSDDSRAMIASLRPGLTLPNGVVIVAAFQGQQPTGGFAIRVTRIERVGNRLVVRAIFAKPLDNAIVTQAVTSPVHIVSIATTDASGVREAVLLDETGAERSRADLS